MVTKVAPTAYPSDAYDVVGRFVISTAEKTYDLDGSRVGEGKHTWRLILEGIDESQTAMHVACSFPEQSCLFEHCFLMGGISVNVFDSTTREVRRVTVSANSLIKRFRLERFIHWQAVVDNVSRVYEQCLLFHRHYPDIRRLASHYAFSMSQMSRVISNLSERQIARNEEKVLSVMKGLCLVWLQRTDGRLKLSFQKDLIGRGAFCRVYNLCAMSTYEDVAAEKKVIKVPIMDYGEDYVHRSVKSLNREHEILKDLRGIAGVISPTEKYVSHADIFIFITKQYGCSLKMIIKGGGMCRGDPLRLACRLSCAVAGIHSRSIFHRDIKPGNIFFDDEWDVYLGDFGGACRLKDIYEAIDELPRDTEGFLGKVDDYVFDVLGTYSCRYFHGMRDPDVVAPVSDFHFFRKSILENNRLEIVELYAKRDVYAMVLTILQAALGRSFFKGDYPLERFDGMILFLRRDIAHLEEVLQVVSDERYHVDIPGLSRECLDSYRQGIKDLKSSLVYGEDITGVVKEFLEGGSEAQIYVSHYGRDRLRERGFTNFQIEMLLRGVDADPRNRPTAEEFSHALSV